MSGKAKEFKFSYDRENDDLFIYNPESKSKGNVEINQLVLDFNKDKELVGLQIMNASDVIKDFISNKEKDIVSKVLDNLECCRVDIIQKNNFLIIKLNLISKNKDISPIISMPMHKELSPAIAYA